MFKRIGLLVLANLAVFIMLSVILTVVQMVFGVNFGTMAGSSLNLSALFIFSMVVGFSGSIISLLMSKQMAKMSMGVQMIDTNNPQPGLEAYLVGVVRHEAERAGIPMPEVGIYEGEPNAFATGASASSAMVAVSTGLLNIMNRDEVEAVLAHEISHVKNGDMVTQTLLQGVMNTFVVFFSRIIGWVVDRQILRNEDDAPGVGYYVTSPCSRHLPPASLPAWSSPTSPAGVNTTPTPAPPRSCSPTRPMINALRRLGGMEVPERASGRRQGLRHLGRHRLALRDPSVH